MLAPLAARKTTAISTLLNSKTCAGNCWHLSVLEEDTEAVAAAERLEQAGALFEELREVLRLNSSPEHLLCSRGPTETRAISGFPGRCCGTVVFCPGISAPFGVRYAG